MFWDQMRQGLTGQPVGLFGDATMATVMSTNCVDYSIGYDFEDFGGAYFDLAFSTATSYKIAGHFHLENMTTEKNHASRCRGVYITHLFLKITRQDTHYHYTRARDFRTQRHTRALEGTIVYSDVDNTVVDRRDSSVAASTTTESYCTVVLPASRLAAG